MLSPIDWVANRVWVMNLNVTRLRHVVETNCTNSRAGQAKAMTKPAPTATGLPGGHSEWEPPDPFSNSEVKTLCADASVGFVNVKVGHFQALNLP